MSHITQVARAVSLAEKMCWIGRVLCLGTKKFSKGLGSMSSFRSFLDVRYRTDKYWELIREFAYESALWPGLIVVPAGFVTDFASVPRVPFIYAFAGNTAHEAAVVHDYLYNSGLCHRELADKIFLEAMAQEGIPSWRRIPMYLAVRLFSGGVYKRYRGRDKVAAINKLKAQWGNPQEV